jgi:hypothetical protein
MAPDLETGWETFLASISASLYDTIVNTLIESFVASEVFNAALQPFYDAFPKALAAAWEDGAFNAEVFFDIINPALQDTIGNIEGMEEAFGSVWEVVRQIADALGIEIPGAINELAFTEAKMAMGGATEQEIRMWEIRQRWGWGPGVTEADIKAGLEWFVTEGTMDWLQGRADELGVTVDVLIDDLLYLADSFEEAARAFEENYMLVMGAQMQMQGATEQDIMMAQIRQRWGWGPEIGEAEIRAGLEWFMSQDTAFMTDWLTRKAEELGTTVDQLVSDLLYLADVFDDTAETIEALDAQIAEIGTAIEEWSGLAQSLWDQVLQLQIGGTSPYSAQERLDIVRQAIYDITGGWVDPFNYLAGLSDTEKAATIKQLQDLWSQYIDVLGEVYQRPSIEYQALFEQALLNLEQLAKYSDYMLSEYEVQLEQLEYLKKIAENTSGEGFQHGIDYVPKTGLYRLHEGERVIPSYENNVSIQIVINESKTPRETSKAVRKELEYLLRSGVGRRLVQQVAAGR